MATSYSYDFKLNSHPNKLLIEHLKEVTYFGVGLLESKILFRSRPEMKQILEDLMHLMGAYHDITKAISYFQHYLLSPTHEVIGPKSHALLSALFTKEAAREYLAKTSISEFEQTLLAHFVFISVKRHHGSLRNFGDEVFIGNKSVELQEQIKVFDEAETPEIIAFFASKLNLKYNLEDFKKYIISKEYEKDMPDFFDDCIDADDFDTVSDLTKIEYFYINQLLFGTLLLSDKTDVILDAKERNAQKPILSTTLLEDFRIKTGFDKPKSKIDEIKNKAFLESVSNISKVFSAEKYIYSLTLPTGLGKTITSFGVAMELKKLLKTDNQRLIITIPFTSIIDQNFEVYEKILNSKDSNVLLKHHHLAEPIYKMEEDELNTNKSQFLIETWQSEVVVTTFVQLFNSIFSNDKSMIMKMPNLANSIIILDEIQTIPYKYWQLTNLVFKTLGKIYNCYFILMSATQPLIFIPDEEITEIVPDYKQYFGFFNRTKLFNCTQKSIKLADFCTKIGQYAEDNLQKDILIILNTKAHTKECFEKIKEMIDLETTNIYFLSTFITPFERKKIIEKIKEKNQRKRKIIVSTQLIEAGVDISVDTVFRALAPIDSIIQASGRANRYNEKTTQGEIYLYEIEEIMKATALIYGSDLVLKTKNVLRGILEIEEKDYLELIQKYFKEIRKQSEQHLSKYLEHIKKFEFEDVGKFSLIEERETESIFLQLDEDAKKVWKTFVEITENTKLKKYEQKMEFSKIKAQFYDYVINVSVAASAKSIDFDKPKIHGFYLSELENPSKMYLYDAKDWSKNTGYENKQKNMQFL